MIVKGAFFQRKSLREEVFQLLYSRIVDGTYAPGVWLRQEDISTQLGVSQTPVREALDLLVSAGLAERVPFRGVRVLQLTLEEIVDAYVLRLVLESAAARLAACSITPVQIQELQGIVEQTRGLVTLEDMSTQRQLNKKFHLFVVASGGNALLTHMYETASNRFPDWMLYEYMFRHPELLPSSLEREYLEHKAIADAIASHDADLAVAKVVEHIRNLRKEFEQFLNVPEALIREKEGQLNPLWMGNSQP
jgi:DNA-binding GntR family transcriptional regulator